MMHRAVSVVSAAVIACAAAFLIAAPAQASSCSKLGSTVAMYMPVGSDVVQLHRVGDAIYDEGMPCGGATVYNTDLILIHDTTPSGDGDDLVDIDLSGGPLAPGATDEGPGGVSEIETVLFLHRGTNTVWVTGSDGADDIHAGVTLGPWGFVRGINLNAGAEQGKVSDADVTYQEESPPNPAAYEPLVFDGGQGDDTFDASGGAGFDGGLIQPITIVGGNGNDHLTGGGTSDIIYADPGDDVIDGGEQGPDTVTYQASPGPATVDLGFPAPQSTGALGKDKITRVQRLVGSPYDDVLTGSDAGDVIKAGDGNDVLTGRGGNDTLDGGSGSDTASYRQAPAGVTVSLGKVGPQFTGGAGVDTLTGIENLSGSPFADHLTGDAGPNTLTGWEGADSLSGEEGDDRFAIRDGTRDLVTCGSGGDSVDADQRGVDAIFSDCESTAFAPSVPPPSVPPATKPADTVPPALGRLRLTPRRFPAAKRGASVARVLATRVSYRVSEAATVIFVVQRAAAGRRVGSRCVRPTTKNRSARRCRRWLHVPGRFTHRSVAGVNRLRFTGRVAGTRLRPGGYRLRAVAIDPAGNRSRRRTAGFTIGR